MGCAALVVKSESSNQAFQEMKIILAEFNRYILIGANMCMIERESDNG